MIPEDFRREILFAFLPIFDLENSHEAELSDACAASESIHRSVSLALDEKIEIEDAIDLIEPEVYYSIDDYLDEVERDLGVIFDQWEKKGKILVPQSASLSEFHK